MLAAELGRDEGVAAESRGDLKVAIPNQISGCERHKKNPKWPTTREEIF